MSEMEAVDEVISRVDALTRLEPREGISFFSLDWVPKRETNAAPIVVDYNRNPRGLEFKGRNSMPVNLEDALSPRGKRLSFHQYLARSIMREVTPDIQSLRGSNVLFLCDPLAFTGLGNNDYYTQSVKVLLGGITAWAVLKPRDVYISRGRLPNETELPLENFPWQQCRNTRRSERLNPDSSQVTPDLSKVSFVLNYGGTADDLDPSYLNRFKVVNASRISSNCAVSKSDCHTAVEEVCVELGLPRKMFTPEFYVTSADVEEVRTAVEALARQGFMPLVKCDQYGLGGSVIAVPHPEDLEKKVRETGKMSLAGHQLATNLKGRDGGGYVLPFTTVLVEGGVNKRTLNLGSMAERGFDVVPLVARTSEGTFDIASCGYRVARYPLMADGRGWNSNDASERGLFGQDSTLGLSALEQSYMRLGTKVTGLALLRLSNKVNSNGHT
ncbi:MAG: hypothetical protein AABX70_04595 [Nanoarchaeota archaeon]